MYSDAMRVGTHNTSVMKRKLPSPFLLASCPPVFICYIIVIDDVYFNVVGISVYEHYVVSASSW